MLAISISINANLKNVILTIYFQRCNVMKTSLLFICLLFSSYSFSASEDEKLTAIEAMINKNGINSFMEQFVPQEHSQFPIKKDILDTVMSVYYIKITKAKIYTHILNPEWRKIISRMAKISISDAEKYMPELMRKQSVNSLCSNKLNKIYFKHGVKILNKYSEQNGTEIFTTEVKQNDCNA